MPIIKQVEETGGANNKLSKYASDVTSQCGEDGIIEHILTIFPDSDHWCVEFGAWDGRHFSNTYELLANRGWSGVLIEANDEKFRELSANYGGNPNVQCLNKFVDTDGPDCIDNILAGTPIPADFDFLSIDVDGCDFHIWESIRKYHPKLVVIEFNPSIPNDIIFVQDKNFELNHGNSLRALIELGKEKGYELIATTNWNAFFVRKEYFNLFDIEDNSIYKMRDEQSYATKIFQLMDGTLLTFGYRKLLVDSYVEIDVDELQILPQSVRRFGDRVKKK